MDEHHARRVIRTAMTNELPGPILRAVVGEGRGPGQLTAEERERARAGLVEALRVALDLGPEHVGQGMGGRLRLSREAQERIRDRATEWWPPCR